MRNLQLLIVFVSCCGTAFGREGICYREEEVCGSRCHYPEEGQCLDGVFCNNGEKVCGRSRCYDPEFEECVNEEEGYVCPKGKLKCSNEGQYLCYDPAEEKCTESGAVCPLAEEGCGWNCYDPSKQSCLGGWRGVICNSGEKLCGYDCYDPLDSSTNCPDENGSLCEPGEKSCGGRCYDPSTGDKCFEDSNTLCKAGEENCGWECYDPNTEKCFDNKKVCYSTREPCGDYACYWPHNETCYTGRARFSPSSCPNTLKPCGYNCYDPKDNVCLEYADERQILCPLGAEVCNQRCHALPDEEKKCMNDVLCKKDHEVCGRRCYDPSSGLQCHNNQVLCQANKKPCGRRCYDPEALKCVEFPSSHWDDWDYEYIIEEK